MAEITKSTFSGNASDDVVTVDVYKTNTPALRNKFEKITSVFGQTFDYALNRTNVELRDIKEEDLSAIVKSKGNTPSETDQLKDVLKLGKGSLSTITKDTKNFLLDALKKNTNSKSVEIDYEGELAKIGVPDLKDSEALGSFISDITGEQLIKIINTGAKVALTSLVLKEVSKLDMSSALDSILEKVGLDDAKKAVRSQPKLIVSPGNIDSVVVFIEKLGANTLLANYPEMPRHVLQQYRFKVGVTPANYPDKLNQLVWVMDRLMPNWIRTERNGVEVWNLSVINTASDDALTLLKSSELYRVPAMTAPNYTQRDARSLMRELYPLIALR